MYNNNVYFKGRTYKDENIIKVLNLIRLGIHVSLEIVVWIYDTFESN